MLHSNREWRIVDVANMAELARTLTEHDWCGCNGFRLAVPERGALVFLNDSSPGGIQEYGVCREQPDGSLIQFESLTVSWCDKAKLIAYVNQFNAPDYSLPMARLLRPKPHPPGSCYLCA